MYSSLLPRSPTPRALYSTQALSPFSLACTPRSSRVPQHHAPYIRLKRFLPFPSRVLLAPPAFLNTTPLYSTQALSPFSLAWAPRSSRVSQHHAPYVTQAPAMQAKLSNTPLYSTSRSRSSKMIFRLALP